MCTFHVRRAVCGGFLSLSALLAWGSALESVAYARGSSHGLHWGYRPPAGNPLANLWRMTNPWSAMNGGGIPHHNLGPSDLNMGYSPNTRQTRSSTGMTIGHGTYGQFSGGSHAATSNRSAIFPGSGGNIPNTITGGTRGVTYAPTYYAAPSAATYQTSEPPFEPAYHRDYNDYWHHGYWGGGQLGWTRWDRELGILGFPRWGLGPIYYESAYGDFRNPFVAGDAALAAYATVIDLDAEDGGDSGDEGEASREAADLRESRVLKSPQVMAGLKAFDAARAAFGAKDYTAALHEIDEALKSLPHDPALHEFRGLVLFAQGAYRQAAAVLYAVLAVSPGWDWTTLSGLYTDPEEYTSQLRTLETYRKQNTESPEAAFLVAYHYALCGHHPIAVKHLSNVAKMLPHDNFVPHLATLLAEAGGKKPAEPSQPAARGAGDATTPQNAADAKPAQVDGSKFVGTWHASRGTDLRFELVLRDDKTFTWSAEGAGENRRFEGQFVWAGNQLLLSGDEGTMVGVVTIRSLGGGFSFRLLENAPAEPGLDFDQ